MVVLAYTIIVAFLISFAVAWLEGQAEEYLRAVKEKKLAQKGCIFLFAALIGSSFYPGKKDLDYILRDQMTCPLCEYESVDYPRGNKKDINHFLESIGEEDDGLH